jgi:hypothetical protein
MHQAEPELTLQSGQAADGGGVGEMVMCSCQEDTLLI